MAAAPAASRSQPLSGVTPVQHGLKATIFVLFDLRNAKWSQSMSHFVE
jgi:hypothetical protein